uniref:Uncharacterized protein n=1 Tax=Trypanosoma congolense (strain IL3000) TaxID=1068625 RepID=G0UXB6_TRYCI|nr:conserved hypothetical protein [Trypanosoma congolense IL3000]
MIDPYGYDAVRRVESALFMYEQQRMNQHTLLQNMAMIEEALEGTKVDSLPSCAPAMPITKPPRRDHHDRSSGIAPLIDEESVKSSLNAVLCAMWDFERAADLAMGAQCNSLVKVDKKLYDLTEVVKGSTTIVGEYFDMNRQQCLLHSVALSAAVEIIRLGCSTSHTTPGNPPEGSQETKPFVSPQGPRCAAAMRGLWASREEAVAASIAKSVEVHGTAANTTCGFLRSGLMEEFTVQRQFPSPSVWEQRRATQAEWRKWLREEATRQMALQRCVWERHKKAAQDVDKEFLVSPLLK